jgi:LysM repeat protein
MYRRRKRRSGRLVLILGTVVVLSGLWIMWPSSKTTQADANGEGTGVTNPESTSNLAAPTDTRQARVAVPEIMTPTGPTGQIGQIGTTASPEPEPVPVVSAPEPDPAPITSAPDPAPVKAPAPVVSVPIPEGLKPASNLSGTSTRVMSAINMIQTRPLEARRDLSELVASDTLGKQDRAAAREALNQLNNRIFFTPSRLTKDTFTKQYVVQSGDSLERIARRDDIHVEWGMIQDLNDISNPAMIRLGQRLKIPNGTFHAMVSKSEYTLDLWLENADGRVIIASMPVGLGELNGTPTGNFRIRKNSKLKNPQWKNPRTGEFFLPDDPMNPIGEHWIGLQGTDDSNKELLGIGIHGTIDLDSIGANRSMGCIRMMDLDVKRMFDALTTSGSTVTIVD